MFDAGLPVKLEILKYRCGEKKLCQYVKPFSSDTGALGTDRQTDGQNCYITNAHQCADVR